MKFEKFQYIYPPRPETSTKFGGDLYRKIQRDQSHIAQLKINGQRNLIYIYPDGKIELWNRHKEHHRNYKTPGWLEAELKAAVKVEAGKFTVIDSELVHAKDASVKNTFYLYDLLVLNGDYLLGSTYIDRHRALTDIMGTSELGDGWRYVLSEHIWVAGNITPDLWDEMWKWTDISWVEGYVLKNPMGRLLPGFTSNNNSSWMIRCRKRSESGHVRF